MTRASTLLRASVFMQERNHYLLTLLWVVVITADATLLSNPYWIGL